MKQLFTALLLFLAFATTAQAQEKSLFNGRYVCDETGLQIYLDLDEESIDVPGMSFLGKTNGYLDGKTNNHVYGVWMLMKFSVEGNKAKLRFTNDIGSDSQDITITRIDDTHYEYATTGGNNIRKVVGRKLVKIPATMTLRRIAE